MGKKGLLLSPAIYPLSMPVTITTPGFVILGLGFATLVSLESWQKWLLSGFNGLTLCQSLGCLDGNMCRDFETCRILALNLMPYCEAFTVSRCMSRTHQPAQGSLPAIHIVTDNVRIAGVLLEGGFDANPSIKTEALLLWQLSW